MKSFLVITILLICSSTLFASSYYKSNALMQRIAELEEPNKSGYTLQVRDNEEILFLDNVEVKRRVVNNDVEITKEKNVITTIYNPNNPERIVVEVDGKVSEEKFEYYDDNRLKRRINMEDGKIVSITSYDYSPSSGLTSFWVNDYIDPYYISNNSYTFIDENESTNISMLSNIMVKKKEGVTLNQSDDKITVRSNDEETIYSINGDVIKKNFYSGDDIVSSIDYFYENGDLVKEIFTQGDIKTITEYNGNEKYITTLENDNIKSKRKISSNGIYETIYRNGNEYAIVRYDVDGKRALEVKML